ncbi:hypothetical protein SDC9_107568 [bioreactor metagenome]|uniref:YlbF family regulator n=1 Tax=bioreactor metagenome TaxID=1076179 RepID=A0A645B6N0_9ZZZZ
MNKVEIFELAKQLGEEILKTPETKRILDAKAAYESNEKAVELVESYNKIQNEYQEKITVGELSKEEYEKATNELIEKGQQLRENAVTSELINAENAFNEYMSKIYKIISTTISGEEMTEEDLNCSGSCESCGGCH